MEIYAEIALFMSSTLLCLFLGIVLVVIFELNVCYVGTSIREREKESEKKETHNEHNIRHLPVYTRITEETEMMSYLCYLQMCKSEWNSL